MTCTVTGILRDPQGATLPTAKVVFERVVGVVAQDGAVVVPRMVETTSNGAGAISVVLYPGQYVATTMGATKATRFVVGVPDAPAAQLADLIEQLPALTPSVLEQVTAARDQAIAAASQAGEQSAAVLTALGDIAALLDQLNGEAI